MKVVDPPGLLAVLLGVAGFLAGTYLFGNSDIGFLLGMISLLVGGVIQFRNKKKNLKNNPR